MSVLELVLDDRSFDDLEELARSQLPAKAPGWTDYNLHDPGITLIELMAWLSESQIHSLARLRRDEREAFASLAGVALAGVQPAAGVIWPDTADPGSAINTLARPEVIGTAAGVTLRPVDSDRPVLHARHATLLLPGRILALATIGADGQRTEQTAGNERGSSPFLPFGPLARPRDRLRIEYRCTRPAGLADRGPAEASAVLSIGVRVADETSADTAADPDDAVPIPALAVTLIVGAGSDDERRFALTVVEDGTAAFSRSGVLALRLPPQLPAAQDLAIELRAPRGFAVPPRIRSLALNAIAVQEGSRIEAELHVGTGLPDQVVELDLGTSDLRIDGDAAPRVEVFSSAGGAPWSQVLTLDDADPRDFVYALDAPHGRIRFGNGVNGCVPEKGAQIFVTYSVSEGARGNQPRPRAWFASGLGSVGRTLDPLQGGRDSLSLSEARAAARRRLGERHTLVTAADIAAAALATAPLQVARAEVLPFAVGDVPGTVTLLALRARHFGALSEEEPQRWLDALRQTLQPRLPLGQRLVVRAPYYADFSVQATLRIGGRRDASKVEQNARAELARRLDPIASPSVSAPREFGIPLTAVDLSAWLRNLDGVSAVTALTLRDGRGKSVEAIALPAHGLPRLDPSAGPGAVTIDIVRSDAPRSR